VLPVARWPIACQKPLTSTVADCVFVTDVILFGCDSSEVVKILTKSQADQDEIAAAFDD